MNLRPTIPFAKLSDVNSEAFYNDVAHAIFYNQVRAYRTAILAGDHNDIEATGEAIRIAIVKALKDSNTPILKLDNDTCGNG